MSLPDCVGLFGDLDQRVWEELAKGSGVSGPKGFSGRRKLGDKRGGFG